MPSFEIATNERRLSFMVSRIRVIGVRVLARNEATTRNFSERGPGDR
jgi:hypothetical protein